MFFKKNLYLHGFFPFILLMTTLANAHANLPNGFVYLKEIDPTILQEIRYNTDHNFIGHPLPGYYASTCILTKQAALQLKKIQTQLKPLGYTLKVYDCYRPQQAVDFFVAWSKNNLQPTKAEFFPNIDKKDFFKLNYVATKSGHTRGSTMDLTLVKLPVKTEASYRVGQHLVACYAPYSQRFHDNMIDMGTGYDCFSDLSHPDQVHLSLQAYLNRMLLRYFMEKYGFIPLATEWWHFTLKNEPYPNTYFNFPIR